MNHAADRLDGRVEITTRPSRHQPWKQIGTLQGDIPAHWLAHAVFSRDLLPFHIGNGTLCVIPLNIQADGLDPSPLDEPFWQEADGIWQNWRSSGRNTPKTLLGQIDYQRKLSAQLSGHSEWIVAHNSSGQYLRAARARKTLIVDNACFRIDTESEDEAAYLTSVLNADALQERYRATRKSDRDFHTHIWREVPIPRYKPNNPIHQELALLCYEAEEIAGSMELSGGQVQRSEAVRRALRQAGVAAEIDAAAKEVVSGNT